MFRIVTGSIITLVGLFFLVGGIMRLGVPIIFGVAAIVIGGAILLNKKEDEIEQIKNTNHKNYE